MKYAISADFMMIKYATTADFMRIIEKTASSSLKPSGATSMWDFSERQIHRV